MSEDKLLLIEDVARRWQCSVDTVRRLLRTGKLSGVKVGALWRISAEAVKKYEAENTAAEYRKQTYARKNVIYRIH